MRVHVRGAAKVTLVADDGADRPMTRGRGDDWLGEVGHGARYGVRVQRAGAEPAEDDRVLVDPNATEVWFAPGHRREARRPGGRPSSPPLALAVASAWPARRPTRRTTRPLVVYETHVRGLTKTRHRQDAGTFQAAIDELPRLAALGVSVIELLPIHQFDPDEGNYWGYMPLVFGAVHGRYAAGDDAAAELADLVGAAHDNDIEVWIDVVFNHTTEEDADGPVYNLRALDERGYYVVGPDGAYVDEAGTGNIVDATSPHAQRLIVTALDRFADLGIDGFRFDLAAVLARAPEFVRSIGDWAGRRQVRVVAEPWDLARYQLGRAFPDDRWMQWNDRYRDDVRGFLRGEPALVPAMMLRLAGSPDLFDTSERSLNFLTAHDGFTLYDLVSYDRKHNDANGWSNADGTDDNRSWNCGWEGDEGVPTEVVELRRRQIRNAMCLLMLSRGVPMFVAGDEFGRTQSGNNNPYNQDNPTSWIDWTRRDEHVDLERFVRRLIEVRAATTGLDGRSVDELPMRFFGVTGGPDVAEHSRSLAWSVGGLYAMANMWWEPLTFEVPLPGPWRRALDTADPDDEADAPVGGAVTVDGRSIVVLRSGR